MTYNSNENDSSDSNKEFINEKNKKDFNFANSCYNNLFKKENKEKSINFEIKKKLVIIMSIILIQLKIMNY